VHVSKIRAIKPWIKNIFPKRYNRFLKGDFK